MLEVSDLSCSYGAITVVRDLSLAVEAGTIHALLGVNGAGKSSTIMCIAGLVEQKKGTIKYQDNDFGSLAVEQRIRKGVALVPEGRRIFANLSVKENLVAGGHILGRDDLQAGLNYVYQLFPILGQRTSQLAGSLSGGEQQMLAMGRALVSKPRLLLIDELSLGLMPKVIDDCYRVLEELRSQGMGILLVEQNTERALAVADAVSILEAGNSVWQGDASEVEAHPDRVMGFLGV